MDNNIKRLRNKIAAMNSGNVDLVINDILISFGVRTTPLEMINKLNRVKSLYQEELDELLSKENHYKQAKLL